MRVCGKNEVEARKSVECKEKPTIRRRRGMPQNKIVEAG